MISLTMSHCAYYVPTTEVELQTGCLKVFVKCDLKSTWWKHQNSDLFWPVSERGESLVLFGMAQFNLTTRMTISHELPKMTSFGFNTDFCSFSNIWVSRMNHIVIKWLCHILHDLQFSMTFSLVCGVLLYTSDWLNDQNGVNLSKLYKIV
jgi:hypothetical protein